MKKIIISLFIGLAFVSPAHSFTLSNFETPESFVVDPDDGSYYVSNINGDPLARDGNGYISKINAAGSMVIQKFIGGKKGEPLLNAPKGLAIVGNNIYVSDIDAVKAFDKETGKPSAVVDLSKFNVKFLNDLAVGDKGSLFVSDMMANRIFKIDTAKEGAVSVLIDTVQLGGP